MLALTVLLGAAMIVATAVPLVRKKDWWIRIFDFPRLQILVIAAVTLFVFLLLVEDWSAWHAAFVLLLVLSVAYQAYMMYPYTSLARPKVRRASTRHVQRTIALVFANVLMTNRDSDELLAIIREEDPDIVLAVETDGWWERELDVLAETHPHVVRQPQNDTYGMLLYSRLELVKPKVEFLIEPDVPSIHALVKLRDGTLVELHCLHPRPPAPQEAEDAKPRDAELILVARSLRDRDVPAIVLGDLNDVAWSRTSYEFQDISGLLDPRVGRGFYHTFHARYPVLRYPLDHCFHTKHFRLVRFKRLRKFGSDHFPVGIELSHEPER